MNTLSNGFELTTFRFTERSLILVDQFLLLINNRFFFSSANAASMRFPLLGSGLPFIPIEGAVGLLPTGV